VEQRSPADNGEFSQPLFRAGEAVSAGYVRRGVGAAEEAPIIIILGLPYGATKHLLALCTR
jgi:hypothetical protein